MKNLIFVMHVKGDDGVQLLGDQVDATKLGTLRTIVPRNGRWQGYSGEELLGLGNGWHELEIPKHAPEPIATKKERRRWPSALMLQALSTLRRLLSDLDQSTRL